MRWEKVSDSYAILYDGKHDHIASLSKTHHGWQLDVYPYSIQTGYTIDPSYSINRAILISTDLLVKRCNETIIYLGKLKDGLLKEGVNDED